MSTFIPSPITQQKASILRRLIFILDHLDPSSWNSLISTYTMSPLQSLPSLPSIGTMLSPPPIEFTPLQSELLVLKLQQQTFQTMDIQDKNQSQWSELERNLQKQRRREKDDAYKTYDSDSLYESSTIERVWGDWKRYFIVGSKPLELHIQPQQRILLPEVCRKWISKQIETPKTSVISTQELEEWPPNNTTILFEMDTLYPIRYVPDCMHEEEQYMLLQTVWCLLSWICILPFLSRPSHLICIFPLSILTCTSMLPWVWCMSHLFSSLQVHFRLNRSEIIFEWTRSSTVQKKHQTLLTSILDASSLRFRQRFHEINTYSLDEPIPSVLSLAVLPTSFQSAWMQWTSTYHRCMDEHAYYFKRHWMTIYNQQINHNYMLDLQEEGWKTYKR